MQKNKNIFLNVLKLVAYMITFDKITIIFHLNRAVEIDNCDNAESVFKTYKR